MTKTMFANVFVVLLAVWWVLPPRFVAMSKSE